MSCIGPHRLTYTTAANEESSVSTPVVTEIVPRPEPVAHDPFIDDLRVRVNEP
jgi:hypothetical protein